MGTSGGKGRSARNSRFSHDSDSGGDVPGYRGTTFTSRFAADSDDEGTVTVPTPRVRGIPRPIDAGDGQSTDLEGENSD